MSETREPPRLMVIVEAGESAPGRLAAALGATLVASVVIAPAAGAPLTPALVQPLIALAQKSGAAALIAGDARLARTLKADGVHLALAEAPEPGFAEAREILGNRFIIGFDAGRSRHDAMTLGEAGADYVGFGVPAFVKDRESASERRHELVAWWSEIFEVPCVAFDVDNAEEAAALADAGADFVAVTLPAGLSVNECARLVARFAEAIAAPQQAG